MKLSVVRTHRGGTNIFVWSVDHYTVSRMSQATLTERPYVNSNLFSGHYLDERIAEREEWECDELARRAMKALQELNDLEGPLVEGYIEDALIDNWIDEVLEVLGFGTQVEVTLPEGGGICRRTAVRNDGRAAGSG